MMDALSRRVKHLKPANVETLTQKKLDDVGLINVQLRDYQHFGVNWLVRCHETHGQQGCILGDEMGLGKTLQTLSFTLYLKQTSKVKTPCLIIAPLSVLGNWKTEFERWAPSMNLLLYMGDKETREAKREEISSLMIAKPANWKNAKCPFDVLLTSYELCLKDSSFLQRFKWSILVVDEAHRLKNYKSLLYQELKEFDINFRLLLTGTPVQNNLQEIYSLLSFISPNIFKLDENEEFVNHFEELVADGNQGSNDELHAILKPFLLRRVKNEVMKELPKKSEVILYSGMSKIQKKLYKAVLTKDYGAFQSDGPNKTRLMNILMQLRKCCCHPYIFPGPLTDPVPLDSRLGTGSVDGSSVLMEGVRGEYENHNQQKNDKEEDKGIEPEPFEIGDHLFEASGKLYLLDKLLTFLKISGHKVLIFSQFTMMLDILQDYLTYKGYTYERLDGSVRGEERYLAVNNFNESDDTFLFMLSTKAGGQGLNLMTADTVIFLDSDFNPQNDLQAAARAHRIGQTRPVKIIRLVSKNTVEEIILKRAENKLKLTQVVIEGGQFSNFQNFCDTQNELSDILKFGLEDLLKEDDTSLVDQDFHSILGGTANGEWLLEEVAAANTAEEMTNEEDQQENMYVFEGHDYSKEPSDGDKSAFDTMMAATLEEFESGERSTRRDKNTSSLFDPIDLPKRKRRELTDEEKEERRRKRAETAAKKAKLAEEDEIRRAFEKKRKRENMWRQNSYETANILINDESSDESENEENFESDDEDTRLQIQYVVGDVTQPINTGKQDAIVVHCLDDSGRWGTGGVFTALSNRSSRPKEQYEFAGRMKDLSIGDAHIVSIDDKISRGDGHDFVALIIAQKRDRNNRLSPIIMTALTKGLERVQREAKRRKASIHLPRIGHNTPNFNWYGTERIIKKLFTSKGIPASVYYFPRRKRKGSSDHKLESSKAHSKEQRPLNRTDETESQITNLPDIFTGKSFFFHEIDDEDTRTLSRYVIAYDGDVEKFITDTTTFVIVKDRNNEDLPQMMSSMAKLVTVKWLRNCISEGRLIDP